MNRPLVAVVLAYAGGLLLAQIFQPPLPVLFTASFLLLVLVLVVGKFRPLLIWPLLALCGWLNLAVQETPVSPTDLRNSLGAEPQLLTIHGTLAETPRQKISQRDGGEIFHSVAVVKVSEMARNEKILPATGEILASVPGMPAASFFMGQRVELVGVAALPPPPLAEGLFDERAYLAARGIYYQLKTESTNDWKILPPQISRAPLTDRFLAWSKRTLAYGLPVEDEPLRLLWAMTLGWRTAFTGEIGDPFLRAGTMHLFAIDGLRIALISLMLVAFFRVLQLSRAWSGALTIPVIWFYTAATGWEASAIRASVMMTIVLGGWALKRPGDLLNSLAAAALIILVWNPLQLFEASFQLSFFVMLTIGLLLPKLNNFSDKLLRHDPLLPEELLLGWKQNGFRFARMLARYFSLSLAAWIGSIPLSAKYFHLFSPVSTFANVVAVPLGTLALMANMGALICGAWFPFATELFNHAAWFFMVAMQWVSVESTKIPGAYFYVLEPSWLTIAIYYSLVVIALSGLLKTVRRKIIFTAVILFIAAFYFFRWQNSRAETDLTVLPLNGGHAVFVDADGRASDWLVDCGNTASVELTLQAFLRAQGVNKVPRLVLTEGDVKNCGGAKILDEDFGVGELWTSGMKFRSTSYREAVSDFEKTSRHKIFQAGDAISAWKVLAPLETNNFSRADDVALVLLGHFSGVKILLLSNLSRAGQNRLLAQTNDLHADIVVAGLPNEGEPLCDALTDAIQPKLVIIADSDFPATRRAGRDLKSRLAEKNFPVIYTRESGVTKIVADKNGWQVETMDGQKFTSALSSK